MVAEQGWSPPPPPPPQSVGLKEDDIRKMEDDWRNQGRSPSSLNDPDSKDTPESNREHPPGIMEEAVPQPPCRRSRTRSTPARSAVKSPTRSGSTMVRTSDHSRADSCSTLGDSNEVVEDNAFERKLTRHITVNGVKLTDIQKNKQQNTKKTTTLKKSGQQKSGKRRQQQGTLTPSSGKRGQLLKYLVEKKADNKNNEDNVPEEY